ncbi:MAG TPA: cytochrome c-type biogenesis protein CcmH [Bryobacteraceae bacterium]|nr:cytochrome c-type biogenesis protein CcmH [Bryobacteraceae bacterium]
MFDNCVEWFQLADELPGTQQTMIALVVFLLLTNVPQLTVVERERAEKLESRLLAPCCYQETVSRHLSDAATAMRAEIAQFISDGKPDREILHIYKARYGARVLVEPEGAAWWWMQTVPLVAAAAGLFFVVIVIRNWRRSALAT